MPFATDTDLLHWEPQLLAEADFASQTLISGSCDLEDSTLTIETGDFEEAQVQVGNVIVLSGAIAGTFPITSVDSPTQIQISTLYDKLASPFTPAKVGTATGLTFSIRTFWAQRQMVSELILSSAGLDPDRYAPKIIATAPLKRACVLGTLQMIYNAIAINETQDNHPNAIRSALYAKLYRRALRQVKLEIDTNNDGAAEIVKDLNICSLRRR
jgi:hypothetical protein